MAAIAPRTGLSFKGFRKGIFLPKNAIPNQRLLPRSPFLGLKINGGAIREVSIARKTAICKSELVGNTDRRLSDCWKEIHGKNDWEGLIEPFDPLLRAEVSRYGDMAQACYDAYMEDPSARFGHRINVEPQMFFKAPSLARYGYNVTSYIYSTYQVDALNLFQERPLWSNKASWIGYVAVSNDEYSEHLGRRDITIAWRGTVTSLEAFADLQDFQAPIKHHMIPSLHSSIKAEDGFLDIYTKFNKSNRHCNKSARMQVLEEVQRQLNKHSRDELSITITGHSLGSALATLNAYDIAETGLNVLDNKRKLPVSVFSFSGPRVGNLRFKRRFEELGVKALRVANTHDAVPKVPGVWLNEQRNALVKKLGEYTPWSYHHVGKELMLDRKKLSSVQESESLLEAHNLKRLLQLIHEYKQENFSLLPLEGTLS